MNNTIKIIMVLVFFIQIVSLIKLYGQIVIVQVNLTERRFSHKHVILNI